MRFRVASVSRPSPDGKTIAPGEACRTPYRTRPAPLCTRKPSGRRVGPEGLIHWAACFSIIRRTVWGSFSLEGAALCSFFRHDDLTLFRRIPAVHGVSHHLFAGRTAMQLQRVLQSIRPAAVAVVSLFVLVMLGDDDTGQFPADCAASPSGRMPVRKRWVCASQIACFSPVLSVMRRIPAVSPGFRGCRTSERIGAAIHAAGDQRRCRRGMACAGAALWIRHRMIPRSPRKRRVIRTGQFVACSADCCRTIRRSCPSSVHQSRASQAGS